MLLPRHLLIQSISEYPKKQDIHCLTFRMMSDAQGPSMKEVVCYVRRKRCGVSLIEVG